MIYQRSAKIIFYLMCKTLQVSKANIPAPLDEFCHHMFYLFIFISKHDKAQGPIAYLFFNAKCNL